MKRKIAIYNGQLYMGGIERVLINYLKNLAKEPDLEIVLIIKENISEKNIFSVEIPKNIKVHYIKSEKLCRKIEKFSKNKKNLLIRFWYQILLYYGRKKGKYWLRNYLTKNHFDAIIDFDTGAIEYLEGMRNLNIIGWTHSSLKGLKKKRQIRAKEKFRNYSHIVVICDDMKKELEEMYQESRLKAVKIYNPVEFEEIERLINDKANFSENELSLLNKEYFIAVSRLVSGKNIIELVEIFEKLKSRGRKEKLYVLGEGEDRINIEKRIRELKLEEDVFLLGEKKNPYPYMKAAKMFLHTSLGEGLPTVFIESMLCNTIVVAYDCPTGPREILMNGKAGGLVELKNKDAFEVKVIEILENNELQEQIKKNMGNRLKEFSYKNIRENLFELF